MQSAIAAKMITMASNRDADVCHVIVQWPRIALNVTIAQANVDANLALLDVNVIVACLAIGITLQKAVYVRRADRD